MSTSIAQAPANPPPRNLGSIFTDPTRYANPEDWYSCAARLRQISGLARIEEPGFYPFWAATRHSAVTAIERDSRRFTNGPYPILVAGYDRAGASPPVKNLVGMDGTEHQRYRGLLSDWFNPRALRARAGEIRKIAREFLSEMREHGSEFDFFESIEVSLPLRFIASVLGIPKSDEQQIHQWTRVVFGAADPDVAGPDHDRAIGEAVTQMGIYFCGLAENWRRSPDDSMGSVIANARIDGAYMESEVLVAYFVLLSLAGHDTVATVLAGGIEALARHPESFAQLKCDLSLLPNAVEEIVRWTTPTKHFMRTAVEDCELDGQSIAAGDWILLSFPSANRDDAVFTEPERFNITRTDASRHLAFGAGAHSCLGQQLARLQLTTFFEELLPMIDEISLAGPVRYTATTFVSSFRQLPVRVKYSSASHVPG